MFASKYPVFHQSFGIVTLPLLPMITSSFSNVNRCSDLNSRQCTGVFHGNHIIYKTAFLIADRIGVDILAFFPSSFRYCANSCADRLIKKSCRPRKSSWETCTFDTYQISYQVTVYQPYQLIKRPQVDQCGPFNENHIVLPCHLKQVAQFL